MTVYSQVFVFLWVKFGSAVGALHDIVFSTGDQWDPVEMAKLLDLVETAIAWAPSHWARSVGPDSGRASRVDGLLFLGAKDK